MPWELPGDKFGTSQGHLGRLGRLMWKFTFKGQSVHGTDGTDDGTDGTCPGDRRDTNQGLSRQNSLCLLVFFFPKTIRVPQKECGKRSSITFFVFGTLLVTFRSLFLMLLSLFSSLFCRTPFAGLLLRQGETTHRKHTPKMLKK